MLHFHLDNGKEWARLEGLHPQTVWKWCRQGTMPVPVEQTPTGMWLIHDPKYETASQPNPADSRTVCYARVSSGGRKGDLQRMCDCQKGAVANVVRTALQKYALMEKDDTITKEQKIANIQAEVEQATALELPTLEQNLPVVATMTTLGTLMGLLGTVIGMIKSFAALANAGAPDSIALSTGISEALVNTAFGIMTGALAVISYNFFTSKIDSITYCIDEIGFTIVQTFSATHK